MTEQPANDEAAIAKAQLFPIGDNPIWDRDAIDRADRLQQPEDAVRLLNLAADGGDLSLAKAILRTALTKRWPSVISAYTTLFPQHEELVGRYLAATRPLTRKARALNDVKASWGKTPPVQNATPKWTARKRAPK